MTMLKKEHLPEFVLPPARFSWENGPVICILKFQELEMVLESNSQVFQIHHQGEVRGLDEYKLRMVGGSSGGGRVGTIPSGRTDNELSLGNPGSRLRT